MTDYGHDLLFGTFVTPSASDPMHVIDLAVTADTHGLDLVTLQDHPYQPAFLDTWTLLAFLAARTERIHLAGNVLSLPLRSPAMLARAAASLDVLSGGRLELGLGSGAFWDGITAMGEDRLTPGQAVEALREGVEIIRALWDTDEPGGVRFDGDYYRVSGAKRGPRPPHDINIWIGAYKPKMLALTGAVSNGWVPTYEYLPEGNESLPEMNRLVDQGAIDAGRSPSDVRRLLNIMRVGFGESSAGMLTGQPKEWVEQLVELVLVHGMSAFLIGGDDKLVTERFAREVVPEVRAIVARERSS